MNNFEDDWRKSLAEDFCVAGHLRADFVANRPHSALPAKPLVTLSLVIEIHFLLEAHQSDEIYSFTYVLHISKS